MEEAAENSASSPPPPPPPRLPLPFPDADAASDPAQGDGLREAAAPLTDDFRDKIVRQVEYYFSDENLPTDKFLLKYVKKNKEGFDDPVYLRVVAQLCTEVPIALIASFRRMKKLVQDLSMIEAALRTSSQLVLSPDGRKVKRLHPLPDTEIKDARSCTVLVENLPEDYSTEYIERVFGSIGNIKNITISDPHSLEESAASKKPEIVISTKLHGLIEYETIEAAESAVVALNDEKNWRSGMRVELLLKRMEKFGLIQKSHKESFSGRNSASQVSDVAADEQKSNWIDQHDEISEKKEEELLPGDKSGWRGRYKNRGRGYLQQNSNGHGYGSISSSSSSGLIKPAPGPRMPDGTRGFTMGRGKPNISHQS